MTLAGPGPGPEGGNEWLVLFPAKNTPAMAQPQTSILDYVQPLAGQLPAAYYPGPGVVKPVRYPDSDSDSDSDSDEEGGPWMRKLVFAFALAMAIVLVILIVFCLASPQGREQKALMRELAHRGWTVYLKKGCGWCHKQMKLLDGFDHTVLCSNDSPPVVLDSYMQAPPLECGKIAAFPYWYNTRTQEDRTGYQDEHALKKMAHE